MWLVIKNNGEFHHARQDTIEICEELNAERIANGQEVGVIMSDDEYSTYLASINPIVIPPKSELEILKEKISSTQAAVDFILLNY